MKILVLGGDGFLGSHFVDRAVTLGHCVTVFDRFLDNSSRNLEHQRGKVKFLPGDFTDKKRLMEALKNQDIVYHFICATNPATSWNDPIIEIDKNIKLTTQFFELAADCGVKKIVFPSSGGSVYGRQGGLINEKYLPKPFNPYAIAKLTIEHFLNYYQERTGIAADIYRIGNAYGLRQPMDTPQGVIAAWMGKILNGSQIQVFGDDNTIRDYIYVEDAVYLLAHSLKDIGSSDVYNLGTGKGVSILKLLDIFRSVIDKPFTYRINPRREFDNTTVVLDSSKLISFFPGFKFQNIEEKIRDTWRYVKENHRDNR